MAKKRKLSKEDEDQLIEAMNLERKQTSVQKISVDVKCKTANQKKFVKMIQEKEIIVCAGLAGTGKTYLACAEALKLLKSDKYSQIVIVKSVTTLKDEEIGFLKGTMKEKMEPFMYSFMDNFNKIIGDDLTKYLEANGYIRILPLAYVRGMSIDNKIIIVDESQNISMDNMESIMTRLGDNSKLILIGDEKQVDMKNKKESALSFVVNKFDGVHDNIGVMRFEECDIVRNPLVKIICKVFDNNRV
jgi:phosphate starvation-inducible protein PhoH and related proteins